MAKGAVWMVAFKIVERSIGLVSIVILARLLVPADFGLVAMATAVVAGLEAMTAFGFDVVLIQKQDSDRSHYDTAWTLSVAFGVFLAIALILIAPAFTAFYGDARLKPIIYTLAAGVLFQGFDNVGIVAFRKELTFHKEFLFLLSRKLAGFLTTVPLAFALRSYWALVCGIVASKAIGMIVSYFAHPYRPRFSLKRFAELYGFSKWLVVNNALIFAQERAADFVIGRQLGPRQLGLYSMSYEISSLPTTELVAPINRAVLPGYAKKSGNQDSLRSAFLDVISLIWLFALPAGVGVALIAPLLVSVMLGSNWLETIPLIYILSILGVLRIVQGNTGSVFLALGRPKINTLLNVLFVGILIPLLIFSTDRSGAVGAAWAFVVTIIIVLPVNYYILLRLLSLRFARLVRTVWRPVVATFTMSAAVLYVKELLGGGSDLLGLIVCVIVGVLSYGATVALLWLASGKPRIGEGLVIERFLGERGI